MWAFRLIAVDYNREQCEAVQMDAAANWRQLQTMLYDHCYLSLHLEHVSNVNSELMSSRACSQQTTHDLKKENLGLLLKALQRLCIVQIHESCVHYDKTTLPKLHYA